MKDLDDYVMGRLDAAKEYVEANTGEVYDDDGWMEILAGLDYGRFDELNRLCWFRLNQMGIEGEYQSQRSIVIQ
jgi:hypothetical protein